jgi:hypothetical protein
MSTEQLSPNSTVPTSGLYHCIMCMLSFDLAKAKGADPFVIATLYAKQEGIDPQTVRGIFAGSNEPIFRKKFKALDKFDECPIHKTTTGWGLEEDLAQLALFQQERDEIASETVTGVCDTCIKQIGKLDGYLLSTKEVVLSVTCWKRFLLKSGTVNPNLVTDTKAFTGLVALRASSDTPWQICEECASMFSFDHNLAKSELLRNRATGEPSSGFGLCNVSYQGKDVIVELLDEEAFMGALKSARMALDQILSERGSTITPLSENVTKKKWWQVWK